MQTVLAYSMTIITSDFCTFLRILVITYSTLTCSNTVPPHRSCNGEGCSQYHSRLQHGKSRRVPHGTHQILHRQKSYNILSTCKRMHNWKRKKRSGFFIIIILLFSEGKMDILGGWTAHIMTDKILKNKNINKSDEEEI